MPMLFRSPYGPPASIINAYSAGSAATAFNISASTANTMVEVQAPGAYTAGTLQTIISHTGRGRVNMLNVYTKNGTSRTLRLKLTVDGTVIFDATSSAIASNGFGVQVLGGIDTVGGGPLSLQPVDYNESLLVEVASSLSEAANLVGIGVNRETWAS